MGPDVDEKEIETLTGFLFPNSNAIYGIARLIDLGARLDLYNESISPAEADCIAIYSDWIMVRKDLEAALSETSDLAK